MIEMTINQIDQIGGLKRFREKCTQACCFEVHGDILGAHQDDRGVRCGFLNDPAGGPTIHLRHVVIDENELETVRRSASMFGANATIRRQSNVVTVTA